MRTEEEITAELKNFVKIENLQNEGGEGYSDSERLTALLAERKAVRFAKNWSKEQTAEKRAAWNNEVRAMQKAGNFDHTSTAKIEKKLGFKMYELKKAVEFHN